jgi:putative addiction module component (TIGR02574 family)
MTTTLQQLGIDRMTIAERVALAQEILDSVIAEQPRPKLSEAKMKELDRRLAGHAENPSDSVLWGEVEAAALARFGNECANNTATARLIRSSVFRISSANCFCGCG